MNRFLKNSLYVLLAVSSTFISCSNDDGDDGPSYEFIDQNLQGAINGKSFELGEGSAEESLFDDQEISFRLYDTSEDISDICGFFGFGNTVSVSFTVPNQVGL